MELINSKYLSETTLGNLVGLEDNVHLFSTPRITVLRLFFDLVSNVLHILLLRIFIHLDRQSH